MALFPLESNPEVMNKFMQALGVPNKWNVVDVYGLDSDALAWIPRPVLALILLFPCSEKYYNYVQEQQKELEEKGQIIVPGLFYMKQLLSNACGTVALIHSIANNTDRIELSDGRFKEMLEKSKDLSPLERGELLQNEAGQIISTHQELALEGQTEPNPNEQVNHHFIAFIQKGGYLYELDGRKDFPVNHGPTTPENFLENAAKVCQEYIARESDDVNFTVLALTASDN